MNEQINNEKIKKPKIKNLKHIFLLKNCNIDFKFLNDCDIIYKLIWINMVYQRRLIYETWYSRSSKRWKEHFI